MKTIFEERDVQFPGRVKLTKVAGEVDVYDVEKHEGTINHPGTAITSSILNNYVSNSEMQEQINNAELNLQEFINVQITSRIGEVLGGSF